MYMNAFHFVVETKPSEINSSQDFLARIPAGIVSPEQLFEKLQCKLRLPDYFGHNWDALFECLRDFDWILERKIIIVHDDLPLLKGDSLRIYLEVLADAVEFWKLNIDHELTVVFPAHCKKACQEALSHYGS